MRDLWSVKWTELSQGMRRIRLIHLYVTVVALTSVFILSRYSSTVNLTLGTVLAPVSDESTREEGPNLQWRLFDNGYDKVVVKRTVVQWDESQVNTRQCPNLRRNGRPKYISSTVPRDAYIGRPIYILTNSMHVIFRTVISHEYGHCLHKWPTANNRV